MNPRTILAAVLLVSLAAPAWAEPVAIEGRLMQGGLMIGRAPPDARVTLDGKPVRVGGDGLFVFGFGRDAGPRSELEITHPDGAVERRVLEIGQRTYRIERIDGLPPAMVTPPPEVLERIRREGARISAARARDSHTRWFADGFIRPTEGPISGVYGSQRILNGEPRRPHYGLDMAPPAGTPVRAPAGGVVSLAESDLYYTGGTVMIDHGHGITSVLMHLRSVDVAAGATVGRGQRIGTVGATGRATGPHLDWRVNWFSVRLDPELVLAPSGSDIQ